MSVEGFAGLPYADQPTAGDVPSLAHPFGRCSVEWCDHWATSRWRVSVGAEPPDDRGVQEQAARLNRLGVALCGPCAAHLGADRV